jgi:aryl-alcohol dehydrogenase-like predicted oxidoreductase
LLEIAGAKAIRLIDTAAAYGGGLVERVLGRSTSLRRFGFQVITKCGWDLARGRFVDDPVAIARQADVSIATLRQHEPPIILIHSPPVELIGRSELYRPLLERKRDGAIRAVGVSVRFFEHAALAVGCEEIDVVELPYNPVIWEQEGGLVAALARDGKRIVARELLGNGLLSDRYPDGHRFATDDMRAHWPMELRRKVERVRRDWRPFRREGESCLNFFVRFALDRPEISAAVIGARTPGQIDSLAQLIQAEFVPPVSCRIPEKTGGQHV